MKYDEFDELVGNSIRDDSSSPGIVSAQITGAYGLPKERHWFFNLDEVITAMTPVILLLTACVALGFGIIRDKTDDKLINTFVGTCLGASVMSTKHR